MFWWGATVWRLSILAMVANQGENLKSRSLIQPLKPHEILLLSRLRSIQRESIVIVKKFELEILTNLHVLDLPESEKHNFGIMFVCEHDNSKTIRATGMELGMWS
ncbi:hypothetical protein AVEN_118926-1 [Araneus ventricosus]|uniref:Uncharacterized protein n=1 Tax=Araneus ventricosus TaxID=182803 RepID=A0A4Y2BZK6_ARAVE|nr:hypothetical protein AVEN_118926-1 [Araneus ventricosus]